jgi:hypothetical protein
MLNADSGFNLNTFDDFPESVFKLPELLFRLPESFLTHCFSIFSIFSLFLERICQRRELQCENSEKSSDYDLTPD